MILFEKDWEDYPTAIVHRDTKNESWVRLAALYKTMGIKNCYFHLSLLQPHLRDVDPYDPNLDEQTKTDIILECTYNPWYFFREVIRTTSGVNPFPYTANRGGIAMIWCFLNHVDSGTVMPRQFGKSLSADILKLWLMFLAYYDKEIFLLTKDPGLRKKNIAAIKKLRDLLPTYLNLHNPKKDLDNTEAITVIAKKNVLRTSIGQPVKENAVKVGRGYTLPAIFIDEVSYITNGHIAIPALLAAHSAARDIAIAEDIPYGSVFTTTAGKLDTDEGKYAYNKFFGGMYWTEKLLECRDVEELKETIKMNSSRAGYFVNITMSHRQLGKTDEWLAERIAAGAASQDEIDRDWLNKWTSGSLRSPLTVELNEAIAKSEMEPLHTTTSSERYQIRWYIPDSELEKRLNSGQFLVGLDSSNAVGKDANFLVIVDTTDMAVVGASTITEANLHKYAMWLANLLIRYPGFTLIPENKASGQAIIDTVATILTSVGICPFTRIFNRIVDDHLNMSSEYKELQVPLAKRTLDVYTTYKKYMGFMTSGQSRHFLYDTVFQEAANTCGHLVRDRVLSDEIKGLIIKNGRIDHAEGGHDDGVIAWLLCHWMVRYSKNLQHYGIDVNKALSMVSKDGAILTEEQMMERRKVIAINERIAEIKNALQSAPSPLERIRLEKVLGDLVREAQALGETTYSTAAILEEINSKKVTKQNLRDAVRRFEAKRGRNLSVMRR